MLNIMPPPPAPPAPPAPPPPGLGMLSCMSIAEAMLHVINAVVIGIKHVSRVSYKIWADLMY